MTRKVEALTQTAELIHQIKAALIIPSYQRPYVWPSHDVIKLLDDIIKAQVDGEPHYYIGTVLTTISQTENGVVYELIDGQQRITTMMLFSLAFKKIAPDSEFALFSSNGNNPRLIFAIREQVQALLGHFAGLADYHNPGDSEINENPYLTNLASAYKAILGYLTSVKAKSSNGEATNTAEPLDLKAIGHFMFTRVRWVNNVVPVGVDLNKLFTIMNTSGIQLQQSDILKSKLLKKITRDKPRYDAIWQACENMNNYFEKNVREIFRQANWAEIQYDDLAEYSPTRFPISGGEQEKMRGLTIAELARQNASEMEKASLRQPSQDEIYCRPIISFSLLLIHAFRVFLCLNSKEDVTVRVNEARLIEAFDAFLNQANEEEVIRFIECLWSVRYQFDRWVVKWIQILEVDEEQLRLSTVSFSKAGDASRLSRSTLGTSNLSQLQSVRYFSGERSAQYWITPFLGTLVAKKATSSGDVLLLLEQIDNALSLSKLTQKEASYGLLGGQKLLLNNIDSVVSELQIPQGTGFEHYWFQKLEYILWRERESLQFFTIPKLEHYRITTKNSIEHVFPQHEEYGVKLGEQYLHSFGNLVLLSPGENSAYGNWSPGKKREDFKAKPKYDSLKLAHMFHIMGDKDWNRESIENHQEIMLDMISNHYSKTNQALIGTKPVAILEEAF